MSAIEERLDRLEEQLEEEREARKEAEQAAKLALNTVFDLEEVVYGDMGATAADMMAKEDGHVFDQLDQLRDRISSIERGEIDPGEVVANSGTGIDPSELLPLHSMYLSAQKLEPEEHDLYENQEIAARLFPFLAKYAHTHDGKMTLPSTKVRDIIEREIFTPELAKRLDVEEPNANTIRRAMKHAAKFSKGIIEFDTESKKTNQLVIDRDEWVQYTQKFTDEIVGGQDYSGVNTADDAVEEENTAEDGVEKELERLTEAEITVS